MTNMGRRAGALGSLLIKPDVPLIVLRSSLSPHLFSAYCGDGSFTCSVVGEAVPAAYFATVCENECDDTQCGCALAGESGFLHLLHVMFTADRTRNRLNMHVPPAPCALRI